MSDPNDILTTDEAAKLMKVGISMLEKHRVYGDGPPFYKVGRSVRYIRHEIMTWLQTRRCISTSDSGRIGTDAA